MLYIIIFERKYARSIKMVTQALSFGIAIVCKTFVIAVTIFLVISILVHLGSTPTATVADATCIIRYAIVYEGKYARSCKLIGMSPSCCYTV